MLSSTARKSAGASTVSMAPEPYGGRSALVLWMIVIAGAILRLIALGNKSFWLDEIASVAIARRATPVFWHFLWHDEGNMAGYYVLLRPWLHFGYREGTVRLLSVIPGVLSIPLIYALGRKLLGRQVGMLSALFLALNACAISVSQEARAYSFVVLSVLLSTHLFVRIVEEPTTGHTVLYAAVAGLTCYFHYFGVLVPAAHYISVIGLPATRRPWKQLVVAAVLIVIFVAPILWLIHAQDTGHISWVASPSFLELYHLGAFLAADSGKAVGAVLVALDLALVGLFVTRLLSSWRDGSNQRWSCLLIASSVATPIILTLLVSVIQPAFYHRFLIICLPGWIMMTAAGATHIGSLAWRRAMITAVCLLSVVSAAIVYRRIAEDWRGAVNYLIAESRPGDRVLYYQSVGEFAGENYRDWLPGGGGARPKSIAIDTTSGAWVNQLQDAETLWLVLYRAKPDDNGATAVSQQIEQRYHAVASRSFRGVSIVEYKAMHR